MIGKFSAKRSGKEINTQRRKVRSPQIGVVVPFGMNRVAGSPQFIVRIKKLLLIQVNLGHMCKDHHVTSRRNRRLICT